jgi:hypothetical protein
LSIDGAVGLVTGCTRDGKPSPHGPPLLPIGGGWDAVRSIVDKARKREPNRWSAAEEQGAAHARGEPLDPDFEGLRAWVLARARMPEVWRQILKKARVLALPKM